MVKFEIALSICLCLVAFGTCGPVVSRLSQISTSNISINNRQVNSLQHAKHLTRVRRWPKWLPKWGQTTSAPITTLNRTMVTSSTGTWFNGRRGKAILAGLIAFVVLLVTSLICTACWIPARKRQKADMVKKKKYALNRGLKLLLFLIKI